MVRTFTVMLAVLPMFMPPGMCICQFVPHRGDTAARKDARDQAAANLPSVQDENSPAPARRCCSCAKRRSRSTDDDTGRLAESASSLSSHGGDPAAPAKERHAPSCPAVRPLEKFKLAQTDKPSLDPLAVAVALHQPTAATRPCLISRDSPRDLLPPASPLFLAHCALLI